jgi:hypothetical protein
MFDWFIHYTFKYFSKSRTALMRKIATVADKCWLGEVGMTCEFFYENYTFECFSKVGQHSTP